LSKLTTIVDIEVYRDYFLAGFKDTLSGRYADFEMYEGTPLDLTKLSSFMRRFRLITFNGSHYDLPILALALTGADCALLKKASDAIINGNMKSWAFEKAFGVRVPKLDHIDLIDVAPGIAGLKIYGGRLHTPKMQDLPIAPGGLIAPEDREVIRLYNHNDLDITEALFNKLGPQINLRERMSERYGVDLRSKSDAQIAEAVIASQVEKITGVKPERPEILPGTIYHYRAPDWIAFRSDALCHMLADAQRADFRVIDNGSITEPPELKGRKIQIGRGIYRMGIGGLHSSEARVAHVAGPDEVIADTDVVSYYPSLILAQGLAPRQMGSAFTQVYRSIVRQRVAAKAAGDKVTADVLKIVVNGSFGKFGSKWSALYAPDLLIQTTVTGQLALLMLIESLENAGIEVLSANTDGIVTRCKVDTVEVMTRLVAEWEAATGLETERNVYAALYSRDVNNYIALKPNGSAKLKGVFADVALAKNPQSQICIDAALAWLRSGAPIGDSIRACRDLSKFVSIRKVQGGAVKDGKYMGDAVRWYYAAGEAGTINYKVNGYKVPGTDGARPCMEMPAEFPEDIDYAWYELETTRILTDIGALGRWA
jgi:hypothetical protein